MNYIGNYATSSTVYIYFTTYNAAGASVTMSGFATSDILVYKNGSVTQRSSVAGFTLLDTDGTDFDGVTGIQGFSIDLSDNTDAGFYAAGNDYTVFVSTVTIDGQTVTAGPWQFSIQNRYNGVNVIQWNSSNVATPDTAGYVKVTVKSGTGTGELNLSSGVVDANATKWSGTAVAAVDTAGYPKVTVKSGTGTGEVNLSGGNLAGSVASVVGAVGSVTGNVGGNVTGSVGSVTGAVGSVTGNVGGNVTGSVGSVTGAVGSVTGNVGGNVTGSVGSVAAGGITAASIATDAVDADALSADALTEIFTKIWTTALTESYSTDGAAPTPAQVMFLVMQRLYDFAISGTTISIKKIDGTTEAATITLDSATTPTSSTRAT